MGEFSLGKFEHRNLINYWEIQEVGYFIMRTWNYVLNSSWNLTTVSLKKGFQ